MGPIYLATDAHLDTDLHNKTQRTQGSKKQYSVLRELSSASIRVDLWLKILSRSVT